MNHLESGSRLHPAVTGWEHFEHAADMGVRGRGETLAAAFEQAALGMTAIITDPLLIEERQQVEIRCAGADRELLLVDWLNAIVYQMATRKMLFRRFRVELTDDELRGQAWGEPIDLERHHPAVEIKGATYTELAVLRKDGHWTAQCVVDV